MSTEHANDATGDGERDEIEAVEVSADAPKPPKARTYKRARAVLDPSRDVSMFGALPEAATHFGIKKLNAREKYDSQFAPSADGEADVREWPIEHLSLGFVRQNWGAGTYRVEWVGPTPNGGRGFICNGRVFTVRALEQASPLPAPAPATGLETAIAFMNMTDQRVNSQLTAIATLANAIAGNRPPPPAGPDSHTLGLMFERQAQLTREAVLAAVAPLQEELSSVRSRIAEFEDEDEDEDDDRRPSPPAPLFRPGEPLSDSFKAMFLNWAASNPDQAMGLAKEALSVVGKIAGAVAPSQPQAPRVRVVTKDAPPPALHGEHAPASTAPTNGAPASANAAWSSAATVQPPATTPEA